MYCIGMAFQLKFMAGSNFMHFLSKQFVPTYDGDIVHALTLLIGLLKNQFTLYKVVVCTVMALVSSRVVVAFYFFFFSLVMLKFISLPSFQFSVLSSPSALTNFPSP